MMDKTGDELLQILEALANPYRLKMIAILRKEAQYVSWPVLLASAAPFFISISANWKKHTSWKVTTRLTRMGKRQKYIAGQTFNLNLIQESSGW
mgnify:CR=1 FL=1